MSERIIEGTDDEGRKYGVNEYGVPFIELHPAHIMDKSRELNDRTMTILNRSKELGFIDNCQGSLPDVLNKIAQNAFYQERPCEEVESFQNELSEFAEYYNSPETKEAIPFFGIEVSDDGNISLIFAD